MNSKLTGGQKKASKFLAVRRQPYTVRHFWQVLYTLCIVTETSWKISDIGSDNFQMISVIFHMMFGK